MSTEKNKIKAKSGKAVFALNAALLLLAVLIPFAFLFGICFAAPSQYKNTFLGELGDKYDRLYSIKEPKIVIIGGSSTAFGLDSELLEKNLNMPVVNFGLYATLGTKVMLDLSEDAIGKDDIIVIAPETDKQTLSLYFNAETVWQGLDGKMNMLKHIKSENKKDMVGAFFGFTSKKFGYMINGAPDPAGVYNHSSFNEYGDIIYDRPYNIMALGYDPNMTVDFDTSMLSEDFIDYLNAYIGKAEKKGAKVYYSFPPINESAIASGVTEETIYNYYDFISRNINCDVISNPNNYILNENYFYDSNFHLNDSGVTVRSANIIKDLYKALGITETVKIEIPEPPSRSEVGGETTDGDNSYAGYFTYSDFGKGLVIIGTTDEAKLLKNITVPTVYNGKTVLAIGEEAFKDCGNLKSITINANIVQFYDRVFSGCNALTRIIMNYDSAEGVAVGSDLFGGAPDSAKMYFPSQKGFESFVSDYFWGPYDANGNRIMPDY